MEGQTRHKAREEAKGDILRGDTVPSVLHPAKPPVDEGVQTALIWSGPHVDLGVRYPRRRIISTRLTVNPHLNRTSLRVLVRYSCVGIYADACNVDVGLPRPRLRAHDMFKKINGISRKVVGDLPLHQGDRALLNSPQVYTSVGPLNGEEVQATAR